MKQFGIIYKGEAVDSDQNYFKIGSVIKFEVLPDKNIRTYSIYEDKLLYGDFTICKAVPKK